MFGLSWLVTVVAEPIAVTGIWVYCLCRYISAKKIVRYLSQSQSHDDIKYKNALSESEHRKAILVITSAIFSIHLYVIVGFIVLLFSGFSFM